jgi:hypothetical protein
VYYSLCRKFREYHFFIQGWQSLALTVCPGGRFAWLPRFSARRAAPSRPVEPSARPSPLGSGGVGFLEGELFSHGSGTGLIMDDGQWTNAPFNQRAGSGWRSHWPAQISECYIVLSECEYARAGETLSYLRAGFGALCCSRGEPKAQI